MSESTKRELTGALPTIRMIQPVQKLLMPGSHPATSSPVTRGPMRVCVLIASCLPMQYRSVIESNTLQSKIRSSYLTIPENEPQELLVRKTEPQFFLLLLQPQIFVEYR